MAVHIDLDEISVSFLDRGPRDAEEVLLFVHGFPLDLSMWRGQLKDSITTCAEMSSMAENLPNGQFVEIASAGHLAPLEQPAAVDAAIREFMQTT